MKSISTTLAAVVLAAGSTYAMAQQSKSNVNVDNVIQGGGAGGVGSSNKQNLEIGNATKGGQSNVNAKNIIDRKGVV